MLWVILSVCVCVCQDDVTLVKNEKDENECNDRERELTGFVCLVPPAEQETGQRQGEKKERESESKNSCLTCIFFVSSMVSLTSTVTFT